MVRGLDECVHLPNLVDRKSKTKGRHLRPLATVDHRCEELFVAELCLENVRSACAGALMTNQALASIDIATVEMASGCPRKGSVSPSAFATSSGDKPKSKAARRRMKRARNDPQAQPRLAS